MKTLLSLIISGALVVSGYSQTRNVLVGTNNAVVQPTNFWSADASNARSGLGLGTAATNPASAFQPSSLVLSNLSSNNAVNLTNILATNIVGIIPLSNIPSLNLTNLAASNIVGTVGLASNITGTAPLATNVTGIVGLSNGGTGGTNAESGRSGLGGTTIGSAIFTLEDPSAVRFLRLNANNTVTALSDLDFRLSIGLDTAATNPSSAFQPSSSVLTNLASSNGSLLTNIAVSNVVGALATNGNAIALTNFPSLLLRTNGDGAQLTNITAANINGAVALASNVSGVVSISNGGTGASDAASARTELGATTAGSSVFTLSNPNSVSFLRYNANNTASALSDVDFRVAIGLGTAATNPSSAFQPSSSALTNLASNNAGFLTNVIATNIVGIIPSSNISIITLTNVTGVLPISQGGTGSTNSGGARTNLGLGATNSAFVGLSVGTSNTNLSVENSSAFGTQNFIDSTAGQSFAFGGANKITNIQASAGGSIVMGLLGNMTNQGAFLFNGVPQGGTVGNSRGNNTFAVNASNGIYLNGPVYLEGSILSYIGSSMLQASAGGLVTRVMTNVSTAQPAFFGWDGFVNTAFSAAQARTNIGLSFAALTNTNTAGFNTSLYGTNTNPVLVNSNGEVVSPTNFWQAAPISTTVQHQTNVTATSTNAATNSRNLFLFSLAPTVSGVTNTVTLPTNTATTFEGDRATIIHLATNSANAVTAIRQLGAATNLITLNRSDEAVLLMYRSGAWGLSDNISYIEPIYFSGTNAAANAAASRTNLGLGITNEVQFGGVFVNGVFEAASNRVEVFQPVLIADRDSTNDVFQFETETDKAIARTNLGLPLAALTNTSVTNFQKAIFYTNTAPSNIGGNLGTIAAWIEIVASNGVTYKVPAYTNVP